MMLSLTKFLASAVLLGAVATAALGCLLTSRPQGCIDYYAAAGHTSILPGGGAVFKRDFSTFVLTDVTVGHPELFLNKNITELTSIVGYAHRAHAPLGNQTNANSRVQVIQIWGWRDRNGNGMADIIDSRNGTTKWVLLNELQPMLHAANGDGGNAVGYDVADVLDMESSGVTSAFGDIVQKTKRTAGTGIIMAPGESWLLLIRVIDLNGTSSLAPSFSGPQTADYQNVTEEFWASGDGDGNADETMKWMDAQGHALAADGKTPNLEVSHVQDRHVAAVYIPKQD